jgi:hypothetical protein
MLETVLPALDGEVRLLAGPLQGSIARLKAIHTERFCASVKILEVSGLAVVLVSLLAC